MAKKDCNCMSAEVKQLLEEGLNDPELNRLLVKVPECPDGASLRFCAGRGKGAKRAPSAYNEFIGACMKEGGPIRFQDAGKKMKTCAAQWKAQKG